MAILRDFICLAHGAFESFDESPLCPHGCNLVKRVHLKPPAVHNGRTRNIDQTLTHLAKEHGLSDMSNKHGSVLGHGHESPAQQRERRAREAATEFVQRKYGRMSGSGSIWGTLPPGGTFNAGTHAVESKGVSTRGVEDALAAAHAVSDGDLAGYVVQHTDKHLVSPRIIQDKEKLAVTPDLVRAAP